MWPHHVIKRKVCVMEEKKALMSLQDDAAAGKRLGICILSKADALVLLLASVKWETVFRHESAWNPYRLRIPRGIHLVPSFPPVIRQ